MKAPAGWTRSWLHLNGHFELFFTWGIRGTTWNHRGGSRRRLGSQLGHFATPWLLLLQSASITSATGKSCFQRCHRLLNLLFASLNVVRHLLCRQSHQKPAWGLHEKKLCCLCASEPSLVKAPPMNCALSALTANKCQCWWNQLMSNLSGQLENATGLPLNHRFSLTPGTTF